MTPASTTEGMTPPVATAEHTAAAPTTETKHTPGPWTVRVWKKGKMRKAESINIGRTRPAESSGPYPSIEAAQAECDALNAEAQS